MDIHHTWTFFEIAHGKGDHDGVGACIKHAFRIHQLTHSAARFVNSLNVVYWCKENLIHEFNERTIPMRRYVNVSLRLNLFMH